jgi:phosphosulfolactate phosphohydrolase-like enzyme
LLVERTSPGEICAPRDLGVAVVIDVLRATSTAVTLFSRGIRSLPIVARITDLAALPEPATGPYLIFSELSQAVAFERVDNSPVIASAIALSGRTPVLLTTNGTATTCAAVGHADLVLLASFLNIQAVARHLLAMQPDRVTLVPSGNIEKRESHVEDERCADALAQLLQGETPDFQQLAAECLASPRVQRRMAKSEQLAGDVRMALTPDRFDIVIQAIAGPSPELSIAVARS